MHKRRFKTLIIVLAVLLNLGGGPMSWAHFTPPGHPMPHEPSGGNGALPAVVVQNAGEHCLQHQHAASSPHELPRNTHHTPSCCAGGHCHCGCPSAPALVFQPGSIRFGSLLLQIEPGSRTPGVAPLSDPLRPPIA